MKQHECGYCEWHRNASALLALAVVIKANENSGGTDTKYAVEECMISGLCNACNTVFANYKKYVHRQRTKQVVKNAFLEMVKQLHLCDCLGMHPIFANIENLLTNK